MTPWSTPALLLLGIGAGPYGLNVITPSVLVLVDPGTAMALAMLGVFVGLSFDPRPPGLPLQMAASGVRTLAIVAIVGGAAGAASSYWFGPGAPTWLPALLVGVCAAVADAASDVNIDDVLMIIAGGLVVAAMRMPSPAPLALLVLALAGASVLVALAGWLLVGQTGSEGEQHVFVVGSLLLLGGAATYLSLSAVFAGLMAGLAWNLAGNVSRARIVRDLNYFQHPFVVLVLVAAGAAATVTLDAMALGAIFVAVRAVARPMGAWLARGIAGAPRAAEGGVALISAGLIGLALAVDAFRVDARPEWVATVLGAIVIGTIVSEGIALFVPLPGGAR